ncbi:hypothetical protein BJ875DRAFT_527953 [Amylocarpus encephaloides]|uniref:Uncharacterized protein n=1 Tax=Amylocarpus encephaloides TaxID=45428 RepID=A0A9P8C875_9HELO|nr:hypothetical protein BJ875DRAFT_527953 [Amylocarpus encephaloides]
MQFSSSSKLCMSVAGMVQGRSVLRSPARLRRQYGRVAQSEVAVVPSVHTLLEVALCVFWLQMREGLSRRISGWPQSKEKLVEACVTSLRASYSTWFLNPELAPFHSARTMLGSSSQCFHNLGSRSRILDDLRQTQCQPPSSFYLARENRLHDLPTTSYPQIPAAQIHNHVYKASLILGVLPRYNIELTTGSSRVMLPSLTWQSNVDDDSLRDKGRCLKFPQAEKALLDA